MEVKIDPKLEESVENVSRTGRQRKKSAKVLEMEAEADELEEVLRARVDSSHNKTPAATTKMVKARSAAKKALAKVAKAGEMRERREAEGGEMSSPPHLSPQPPLTTPDSQAPPETVSKSGRVRKKSAKLLEMVEVEEMEKKIFRSSDIPKSMRTSVVHTSQTTPAKKIKLQSPPQQRVVSTPSGSTVTSQGGSTIQLLLTSPVKKSPGGPGSPPPEPILLTLGASLNSPSKIQHVGSVGGSPVLSHTLAGSPPVLTAAIAAPVQPIPTSPPGLLKKPTTAATSPGDGKPKDFEVKFLADCPDVVIPPKPVKRKSKKQANPTPSAPALPPDTTKPTHSHKATSKSKKSPSAAVMADQPLLSKIMGEVGHAPHAHIGPPPPSSAEAKSMKKKALKQAKEAAKMADTMVHTQLWNDTGTGKKKIKDHVQVEQKPFSAPMPVLQPVKTERFPGLDDDEDGSDHLMIDTSISKPPKKKVKKEKKEKSPKPKISKAKLKEQLIQARIQSELILKQELERAAAEESQSQEEGSQEEDEEDFASSLAMMPELPSYANTNEMANKVLTSSEKKASKEKKKKKGATTSKEDADKQKKKRSPTAYMLYCNAQRSKLVTENPGIDFATISKRLGEKWQGLSEKEKMFWKKKAKKLSSKGSTVINTGKGNSKMLHGGLTTVASKAGATSASVSSGSSKSPGHHHGKGQTGSGQSQKSVSDTDAGQIKHVPGITPLDVAAHLKLLGESLSIIGSRLQEHHGQIAVQGTLPVLLDSLLCALGPLTCLTSNVHELNGAPLDTHTSTLDNISYIMPGIG